MKSVKDVYEDTKVRVACYMAYKDSEWIKLAWENELRREGKSLCRDVNDILTAYQIAASLDDREVQMDREIMIAS